MEKNKYSDKFQLAGLAEQILMDPSVVACHGIVVSYHNEECKKIPNKTWDICLSDITDTPHLSSFLPLPLLVKLISGKFQSITP